MKPTYKLLLAALAVVSFSTIGLWAKSNGLIITRNDDVGNDENVLKLIEFSEMILLETYHSESSCKFHDQGEISDFQPTHYVTIDCTFSDYLVIVTWLHYIDGYVPHFDFVSHTRLKG